MKASAGNTEDANGRLSITIVIARQIEPAVLWMFTRSALGGEIALEQTFHLDVAEMAEPARAPIRVLERLSGRALA